MTAGSARRRDAVPTRVTAWHPNGEPRAFKQGNDASRSTAVASRRPRTVSVAPGGGYHDDRDRNSLSLVPRCLIPLTIVRTTAARIFQRAVRGAR